MEGRIRKLKKKTNQANKLNEKNTSVEFGQELGDVNASKFFDTQALFKEKDQARSSKKKC